MLEDYTLKRGYNNKETRAFIFKYQEKIYKGVYHSSTYFLRDMVKSPKSKNYYDNVICHGVADNINQVLKYHKSLLSSKDAKYVVEFITIHKKYQPANGGWRWHKWGEYIGKQEPTEYIYDEEKIKKVICYNIIEIE